MLVAPKNTAVSQAAATLAQVLAVPLVPVFNHADAAHARQILGACYAGGIRAFEFTNRGDNALAVFRELHCFAQQHCPGLQLGIGTIYTAAEAEDFLAAGAAFVVQPVTTAAVAAVCQRHDVLWVPGALTPNEVYHATELGAPLVKLFPGSAVGPDYLRALRGPLPKVKIMVTGGVEPTAASLGEWLGAGANCLGLGSQLFKQVTDSQALATRVAELLAFAQTHKP
ncbi:bifunctional 4-hydroxy-2-oxoglutarate aldolase/2-dehydro-3-deoxy-phosphogluconate aldolase [Hymenobacter lapidarius]|uniref:Bifunctional 4-hydroxy-2-oxoglutarate aldolase/2-dehydro-3-deoxy-phosphogluconate aldolase n=1 Tax=Hymenobacter lapidarius TaxID=1908237 RepID=A0A1G1T879_9BACT|nr:bifunctional 4-hydroxy-2-oxoglutarate aldolase/2-dehydro-3-deoxy-phosphogluconate aldolase [Hymenobacter lapidarius]OGX87034.1 bifunctional 4-hydroxy-2-oxoglutarate aldolase/2-dehydro-3-deoxy-phosphogluconate aldolase [Hymenobacter lapidarius]